MKKAISTLTMGFITLYAASSFGFHLNPLAIKKLQAKESVGVVPPAHRFAPGAAFRSCFTPGQNCEGMIVNEIRGARNSILVQAYSFTMPSIVTALLEAKQRGVDVRVIVDKSQRTERFTGATRLLDAKVPLLVDEKPAIAHNKVIIIDQSSVISGSYNFTRSAQDRNAENVEVIYGDADYAKGFVQNWISRWNASVPF